MIRNLLYLSWKICHDSRLDLKQPIISVIDRLTEKIQNINKIVNVQVGLFRLEIEDFLEKVFQEVLLNALSHRLSEYGCGVCKALPR